MTHLAPAVRRWVAIAAVTWLAVVAYFGTMLYLVARYQPKVMTHRYGAGAHDSLYQTAGGQLYWVLAPVWEYNRYVVPTLLAVAIGVTAAAWSARRRGGVAA